MKKLMLLLLLHSAITASPGEHHIRSYASYPVISGITSDSVTMRFNWGIEYAVAITGRLSLDLGYDDVFWFEKGAKCGNDYLSFVAGISNDFLQNRIIDLNAGAGAGVLYHINESRYTAGTYFHYYLTVTPRFHLTPWLDAGARYSLSNGPSASIFNTSVNSFGIEASIRLSPLYDRIASSWRIPESCKGKKFTGYNIAGYTFLGIGIASTAVSIPFFFSTLQNAGNDISTAIGTVFGTIFIGTGALFELGSIPFFIRHKERVCRN